MKNRLSKFTTKDVFDAKYDMRLNREGGINNEGVNMARFGAADMEYLKKLQAAVDSIGVGSINNLTGDVTLTTTQIPEGASEYFTSERAQDAVGGILTNSSSITLSYDDGLNTITAAIIDSYVNTSWLRRDGTVAMTGVLPVKAGNSAANANVGGVIEVNTTAVGNVTTGEDDLITFTIPANTLNNNGDQVEFDMAGVFAATANNKRVRVYIDNTLLFDTTDLTTTTAEDWSIKGIIIKTGTGTQKCIVQWLSTEATLLSSVDYSTVAEDETAALVLKATGEATATDDILQEVLIVKWNPSA